MRVDISAGRRMVDTWRSSLAERTSLTFELLESYAEAGLFTELLLAYGIVGRRWVWAAELRHGRSVAYAGGTTIYMAIARALERLAVPRETPRPDVSDIIPGPVFVDEWVAFVRAVQRRARAGLGQPHGNPEVVLFYRRESAVWTARSGNSGPVVSGHSALAAAITLLGELLVMHPPSTKARGEAAATSRLSPEELRAWRAKHGLTQADAAALVGVPRRSWQNWEGRSGRPPAWVSVVLPLLGNAPLGSGEHIP